MTNSIQNWGELGENLILVMSPERSGSTMFQMMLESHSAIYGVPEPNILPPLKYLGYYGAFGTATAYESINQSAGLKDLASRLPNGEEDYLKALRSYANSLYRDTCCGHESCLYFVDKTPANVLVWDVIVKLFPKAKYIRLVRHPYALIHSYAKSFFTGDMALMAGENTRIPEHIRACAQFENEAQVQKITVRYEDLVERPEEEMKRVLSYLGLPYEESVVHYGSQKHVSGVMGDPVTAQKESRPQKAYAFKWTAAFLQDPKNKSYGENLLSSLSDQELRDYGYPRQNLSDPLKNGSSESVSSPQRTYSFYQFQRKVFFTLKGMMKIKFFRRIVESMQYYCDLLLR